MKKFALLILLLAGISSFYACKEDNTNEILKVYKTWYKNNNDWIKEMQGKQTEDGKPFYEILIPQWNPGGYVLIHWYNDRAETEGNLQPYSTSTVDVKYNLYDYTGSLMDTSESLYEYGNGIYRTQLNSLIEGWMLALTNMRVGDTCQVIIPYQMAYGEDGDYNSSSNMWNVLPYSNLRFEIRLANIYRETLPPGD